MWNIRAKGISGMARMRLTALTDSTLRAYGLPKRTSPLSYRINKNSLLVSSTLAAQGRFRGSWPNQPQWMQLYRPEK
jgi:hypothetical protein